MNKLRLLANLPIYVDKIPIHSPLLKEIADIGFEKYGIILTCGTIVKDILIDAEKLGISNNYDALLYSINQSKESFGTFLYSLLFFTKIEFDVKFENEDIYFVKDDIKLDRNNYDNLVKTIKLVNKLDTGNDIEELDEFDKRVLEAENKLKDLQGNTGEQLKFADLISCVANFDGNGLNIINIWDLNVYQFYEQLQRGQLKEQYQWNLKLLLAGAKPDNINTESYIKNLD